MADRFIDEKEFLWNTKKIMEEVQKNGQACLDKKGYSNLKVMAEREGVTTYAGAIVAVPAETISPVPGVPHKRNDVSIIITGAGSDSKEVLNVELSERSPVWIRDHEPINRTTPGERKALEDCAKETIAIAKYRPFQPGKP